MCKQPDLTRWISEPQVLHNQEKNRYFASHYTLKKKYDSMKYQKMYEAEDKMITLIRENYNILQSLGSFGISLGFGDKTVREVCENQEVDSYTFLAVVNFTINGYRNNEDVDKLSIPTLLQYLKASQY